MSPRARQSISFDAAHLSRHAHLVGRHDWYDAMYRHSVARKCSSLFEYGAGKGTAMGGLATATAPRVLLQTRQDMIHGLRSLK